MAKLPANDPTANGLGTNLFSEILSTVNGAVPQTAPTIAQSSGNPILSHVPLTVNIILAGVPSQVANPVIFQSLLPSTLTQVDMSQKTSSGAFSPLVQYDITYNFVTAPSSFITGYANYVLGSSKYVTPPSWLRAALGNHTVAITPASGAENYIWTNLASLYTSGYSVVIVNPSQIPSVHFYNGTVADPDTGIVTEAEPAQFMVSYGGPHRMMFMDSDAGPENYTSSMSGGAQRNLVPLWLLNLTSTTGLARAQAEMITYVRGALEGRFVNSFLYTPVYHPAILFNVTIYSMSNSLVWSNYLNTGLLQTAFTGLDPLSTVLQPRVNTIVGQNDPGFYMAFQSSSYNIVYNGQIFQLYNNTVIKGYFAQHLSRYASKGVVLADGTPVKVIPIIVVAGVSNLDDFLLGVMGSAEAAPDGGFGFVEVMTDSFNVNIAGFGLSQVMIHEAGHALGLRHPHNIYDENGPGIFWLGDFSSTPMTYCCPYTTYDTLARENLDQGMTAMLVNQTLMAAVEGSRVYGVLGYGELPPQVTAEVNAAIGDLTSVGSLFRAANPDYATAAADALSALRHIENGIKILYQDLMSITYSVNDSQGQILINANVQVTLPNGTRVKGHTGLAGKFGLTGLPWGNYTYAVSYDGSVVGSVFVKEEGGTIRTLQTGVSSLSIPDLIGSDGSSVAANIALTAPNGTALIVSPGFSARQVQNGTWTVSVVYQGTTVYKQNLNLQSAATLRPSLSISRLSFSVTDDTGGPLANTGVIIAAPNGTRLSLLTDASGTASLGLSPNGNYTVVKVTWQGVEVTPSQQVKTILTGSTTTPVKARVFNMSIRVYDLLGVGVPSARVTLTHPNGTVITGVTNGNGVVTFNDVPNGLYSGSVSYLGQSTPLEASAAGVSPGASAVRLAFGPTSLGVFTVIPGVAIGAGVFLVRRRYKQDSKKVALEMPAYVPSPAPQPPASYAPQHYVQPQPPPAQLVHPSLQYPAPQPQPGRLEQSQPVMVQPPPQERVVQATVRPAAPISVPPTLQPVLTQVSPPPPPELTKVEAGLRFCPMCGTKVYEGAKFCHSCGKQF